MIALICSAVSADCDASFPISSATTAKPLPDSPARAASIDALSASKLVWDAISVISFEDSAIFCTDELVFLICSSICFIDSITARFCLSNISRACIDVLQASFISSVLLLSVVTLSVIVSISVPISLTFSAELCTLSA